MHQKEQKQEQLRVGIMRYILTVISAFLLIYPPVGLAETKEIISEGTYNMGDGETPLIAESRALLQAKRIALEQAGTYVDSYSKVKNFQLTGDEIQVLASGLIEVKVLERKRTIVGDGITFWIKIKAMVRTDKMEEMAKRIKQRLVIEDYRKIQDAYDRSQKAIEELKKQLSEAKGGQKRKQVGTKIANAEKLFQAETLIEKGYQDYLNNENDKAIEAFTQAIKVSPNNSDAFFLRGAIYAKKEQRDYALKDLNKAVELDSTNYRAFYVRGTIYDWIGQDVKAIEDYSHVMKSNSSIFDVYLRRGSIYAKRKMYDMAIKDFNREILMNPDSVQAYMHRGKVYFENFRFRSAIADYQKACDLGESSGCELRKRVESLAESVVTDFKKRCNSGEQEICEALKTILQ